MPENKPATEKDFRTYVKTAGISEELGLVFGFGIVCKEQGAEYYDLHGDHIPEEGMVKAALDFAMSERVAGDMHRERDQGGSIVFMMPLTDEVAKAFEIECPRRGLMIAMKPSEGMLAKFRDGTYTGFSIGGLRVKDEPAEG